MGGRGFWFLALATALVAALADVCRAVSARGLLQLQKPAVLLAAAEKGEGARVEEDVLVKMQMRMRAEAKEEEEEEEEEEDKKKQDVGKELDALLDAHLDDKNRRRGR